MTSEAQRLWKMNPDHEMSEVDVAVQTFPFAPGHTESFIDDLVMITAAL